MNSTENIAGAHITDQDYQEYYNQSDQQYSAHKYSGRFKQLSLELGRDIIKKEGLYKFMDQYDE